MLMRDSGCPRSTTRVSARSTSPRPGSLLVKILLQRSEYAGCFPGANPPTLKSDMKVRGTLATDLMAFGLPLNLSFPQSTSVILPPLERGFPISVVVGGCVAFETGLADDVLVDEQDIPAPDTPARRILPPNICSSRLVSSEYFPQTVLILDVARFKYPPHWVPLTLLWGAMDTIDEATGHPRGFMIISRFHKAPSVLYTMSCRHEGWSKVAKYLTEDVPHRLRINDVKDVENLLSLVFKSAPVDLKEFIKWVAEVRRQDVAGVSSSEEEKARLIIKEEVLKQIKETEIFEHINRWLGSEISVCQGYKQTLPEIAANVCCQGAQLLAGQLSSLDETCCKETNVALVKAGGVKPMTLVSGKITTNGLEQGIDMLVPSSQTEPRNILCDFDRSNCKGMHPSTADVLTVILLALPQHTWSGIKEEKLLTQLNRCVSIENIPSLLQQEVLHLRRQLHFLMIDLHEPSASG
ncbi:hypothetical protein WN944_016661 [Citrus x changshan-huyou]|uniref:glutathione gamma-glutamylcysteinyltransferase n=1 Tax=Citrus x changshan-huyou TaxID=2935761 RepID=A0AAP0M9R3_9ROSI